MKNRFRPAGFLATLLVLSAASAVAASPEEEDCNLIRRAAEAGRTVAVSRISAIESAVRDQVSTARSCMERFGDIAARQTVTIAGLDVSPIRDALFERACNIIQTTTQQVRSTVSSVNLPQIPQIPQVNLPQINLPGVNIPQVNLPSAVGAAASQVSGSGWSVGQIWDQLACAVNNSSCK